MSTSVTVIIPAYNRPAHLAECLGSVQAQSYPALETIIVDDGSDGDSALALNAFENIARIIRLPMNRGPGAARNAGVAVAEGDVIAFLDSDDMWAVSKLEEQVEYLEANPHLAAVYTGTEMFLPNGQKTLHLSKPLNITLADLLDAGHVLPSSLMIRTGVFRSIGGFNESFRSSEDYEFMFRFILAGFHVGFIPQPLTRFRRGLGDNLSSRWWKVLCGQVKVVWTHRDVYWQLEGPGAPRRHIGKFIESAGFRRGGILGQLFKLFGRLARM